MRHQQTGGSHSVTTTPESRFGKHLPARRRLHVESLEDRQLLSVTPQLLKDISNAANNPSNPGSFATVGSVVFFSANDGTTGAELWKSDGTSAGTVLVRDVNPGSATFSSDPARLTNVNGTLFFVASTSAGTELWKSDGTSAGTVLVKDIRAGGSSSSPDTLFNADGTLFFTASTTSEGRELWKSDGTSGGTLLVKDIRPGSTSSYVSELTSVGSTLFFVANDGTHGSEVWKSDGTSGGTLLVRDIAPGAPSGDPSSLVNFNGTLFLIADPPSSANQVWTSDGTSAGTMIFQFGDDFPLGPIINANGVLFFASFGGFDVGVELWKSDGTTAGTMLVKDLTPGSNGSYIWSFANVNSQLFFTADRAEGGLMLWTSDGTSAGTIQLHEALPGFPDQIDFLTPVDDRMFLTIKDETGAFNLWVSDGTSAGTVSLREIRVSGGTIPPMAKLSGGVVFASNDFVIGSEVWKSDGTTAGTVLLKDVNVEPLTNSSNPTDFTEAAGVVFFNANDFIQGAELWATNGTSAGTVLVKDIAPGPGSSGPAGLVNFNGTLFFTANDGTNGIELWKSDGTSSGTVLVKDIWPGVDSSSPGTMFIFDGRLFFSASDATNGRELWTSDGTSGGTTLFKDLRTGAGGSNPTFRAILGGTLLFTAIDDTTGSELWRSDGTTAGTVLLMDIRPGSNSSGFASFLAVVDNTMYFRANDGTHGTELWKTDGSTSGTVLVKDIRPGSGSSTPGPGPFFFGPTLANFNGTLYFSANDGAAGAELWTSDGTSAGTVMVRNIEPAGIGSYPNWLTVFDGALFFGVTRETGFSDTYSLWKSDGTSAGTVLVKEFATLPLPTGGVNLLTVVNDALFFTVFDGNAGQEVLRSDGTPDGTVVVQDIQPGVGGVTPNHLTNINGKLYFSASDGTHGIEPWTLEVPTTSTVEGRKLFYNRSAFDGDNASINVSDDAAVAPDKSAYLPGDGLADFDNVSSYSRGINGIMIDLVGGGTHGAISLSTLANDFVFKVGNNNTPSSWVAAPTPNAVSVRANFDGSGTDRIVITWTDGAIKNQWLEVQVLPTSRTGLTATDVFFWGNKVGDIGSPTASSFTVTAAGDANPIVSGGLGAAGGITNPRDIDRSNTITAAGDRGAAIGNIGAIARLSLGTGGPFAPESGDAQNTSDARIASGITARQSSSAQSESRALPPLVGVRLASARLASTPSVTHPGQVATSAASTAGLVADDALADDALVDDALLDELLASLGAG